MNIQFQNVVFHNFSILVDPKVNTLVYFPSHAKIVYYNVTSAAQHKCPASEVMGGWDKISRACHCRM